VQRHAAAASRLVPGESDVHVELAKAYALVGEHSTARHHLKRAMALNPNSFITMVHGAETMTLLGDHREALDLVERAMLRDPFKGFSFREDLFDINFMLGSRLIDFQSQNMTVAARATADRKTFGHRS
jgi:tetratricopeptide (TPR) repeat protein